MDLRLFSEENMFCFLFSKGRRVLLLDATASHHHPPTVEGGYLYG